MSDPLVVPKKDAIEAWHFLPESGCLANSKRKRPVVAGKVLSVKPPIVPCSHGLHGSIRAIDALQFAPGPIVCRTLHWGEVHHHDGDKLASQFREAIWIADATRILHLFACDVAEEALKLIPADKAYPKSQAAIDAKRLWLDGKATDQELAAAGAAAWAAAGDAAGAAARAAAGAAAWAAAWAAARDAAWAAAGAAAWAAAGDAALAAARAAAWAAARDAQNVRLQLALSGLAPEGGSA